MPQDTTHKATGKGRKPRAPFHTAIEDAITGGVPPATMTLRLTHRDASLLRRDPTIPLTALSFAGGEMRLLGVKVVTGGVDVSALDIPA